MTVEGRVVDLNSDLGEGAGTEAAIMPFISSANIACGAHAGDEATMRAAVRLAKQHDVAVGAHPGYRDPANFGRKPLELPLDSLVADLREQIELLRPIARAGGVTARGGGFLRLAVDTLCVHGDSPGAPGLVRAARAALESAGVRIGGA